MIWLTVSGTHEVVDILKIQLIKVSAPLWQHLMIKNFEGLETKISHPLRLVFHLRYFFHRPAGQALA